MSKKEEDPTPYITQHKKLYSHATKLHDTAIHTHQSAYKGAVDKHLIGEDGEVDFEKLDDLKVQKAFIDTMTDAYISKAQQHFKISKDKKLDDLEKDMLMRAYTGVTKGMVKQYVSAHGKNFKHQVFNQFTQQYTRELQQQLYASAASHLEEDNIPNIVKHVGLESKLDANKINVQEATHLLETFHREGGITDNDLRQIVQNYQTKKPKPKEKK
jgi:hypothetical protein